MTYKFISVLLSVLLLISVTGCISQDTYPEATPEQNSVFQAQQSTDTVENQETTRNITDLGGNQVEIPPASEIERVVIIAPPVTSVLLQVVPDKDMIVGLSPIASSYSNEKVMEKLFPNSKDIDTTFISNDFSVNTEVLLNLDPDIILYYGENQKKGIMNLELPIIDFFPKGMTDPKDVSIAWDNLLREIFEVDKIDSLQTEWENSDKKAAELLNNQTGEQKSALCIFSNSGGSLIISGNSSFDSYTQSFFDKAGLRNVAAEINGTSEVSMEQIYKWNPDMIFIFLNVPAQSYLDNNIEGQDWSLLDAWKNKAIYDIPSTTYSWASPCADSSLMPLWLISKAYPELFSEADFRSELTSYYKRMYNVTLSEEDLDSILALREVNQ